MMQEWREKYERLLGERESWEMRIHGTESIQALKDFVRTGYLARPVSADCECDYCTTINILRATIAEM
jgi:hypothetical protein